MTINLSSPEKCLIIGCGDIGQRLAQQLHPFGYQVTGLRRSVCDHLPYLHYRSGDATNLQQMRSLLAEGFNIIVISMTPGERSDAGYKQAYVDSCQVLLQALDLQQQKPRLILFVSSTAVYGQQDGSWVDETSPTAPEGFSGKRLLQAEQLIVQSGYAHIILRFSGIYGPGRRRLIDQVAQQRASASPYFTNRIHADDCAGVLAHFIEQSKQQTLDSLYLASDSSPTPMIEVVSWIAEQLGVEDFLAVDAVNERGNKRISNQRLLASGYRFRYPDFRSGYATLLSKQ
ncbi:SDR family oxidoreductase [Idiomarina sp. UBA4206]|uniref:SDR family oxidoreductase n=1 Tax=Idiomarina sp. UBA4206 TaxID=1946644 RepID=UPI00257E5560|nr:SDR family oxidoreductase [Idiomarina sp. UBA4206]